MLELLSKTAGLVISMVGVICLIVIGYHSHTVCVDREYLLFSYLEY